MIMQAKTKLYTLGTLAAATAFAVGLAVNEIPWSRSTAAVPPAAVATQGSGLPDFVPLVEKNADAVVNISIERSAKNESMPVPHGWQDLPDESPLKDWMKHFFDSPQGHPRIDTEPVHTLGSGFIISPDGYILTNAHVVDGAKEVTVKFNDRRELKAKVVGADELSDVALIKVGASGLPTAEIGDAKALKVGQWVVAIGSPFGFDHSASQGIVSALGRNLPDDTYVPFIQTDVPINPGNSGGPLIDLSGKVVGVNAQIYSRSGGYMGVSFTIPIDIAMNVAGQLKASGHVTRGWLGVSIQNMNQDLASSFGLTTPQGALVAEVLPDSPAAKSGIRSGDVILSFAGKPVESSKDLPPLVALTQPGQPAQVEILRDGRKRELTVTIAKLAEDKASRVANAEPAPSRLNLGVENLSPAERAQLGVDRGVRVTEVGPGSAESAGIEPGDIVLSLDNKDIKSVDQMKRLVNSLPNGKPVPLLVKRNDGLLFLAIRPGQAGKG
jgi:serine protease Do